MDDAQALAVVQAYKRMGLMIGHDGETTQATHIPFYFENGYLIGHIARANPHWRNLDGESVLIILMGADAYITPHAYPSKAVDGKVVPTWNYERIDVRGVAQIFKDRETLLHMVSKITDKMEADQPQVWSVSDAPPEFVNRLCKSIIGVRVKISSIIGKSKMDQDEPYENREGVVKHLRKNARQGDHAVADIMAQTLNPEAL